jgi:hypothetical protein
MLWADLVILLAVVQFMFLATLVGRARGRYSVKAPATTGHEIFERYYRVQMNSLELLVMLIPVMMLAARYWSASAAAILGAIYLVGRFIYLRAYVSEPGSRSLGYALSAGPIVILAIGAGIGMVRALAGV